MILLMLLLLWKVGPFHQVAYTIQITKDEFVYLEKAAIRNAVVLPHASASSTADRREKKD